MAEEEVQADLRQQAEAAIAASNAAHDPDYPVFHLAPPVGRLNDPNGLVLRDGEYHAFYQFSPFHPHRKLVYWGHASSTDLTRWRQRGIAVVPDSWYDRNGAYSGSALPLPDEVRFYYTGNVKDGSGRRESYQCLVTSADLESFTKVDANPLLWGPPPGYTAHIRDPQVWADGRGGLRMCLGAQRDDLTGCVLLYRSPDGLDWTLEGELTFPDAAGRFDAFGYMWECPNLVRVPDVDGERLHDVLIMSPQGIDVPGEGFENIFACGYMIGELSDTALRGAQEFHELDRGFEFYAPQTIAGATGPHGGPLLLAWVGNASEDDQPSIQHGWVHTLSVARELLVRDGRLIQRPLLGASTDAEVPLGPIHLADQVFLLDALAGARSFRLRVRLQLHGEATCRVRLGSSERYVDITLAPDGLEVDRSATAYPHGERRRVSLETRDEVEIEVIHDRSVTEIFLDDGAVAFSQRSYLQGAGGVALQVSGSVEVQVLQARRFD